MGINKIGNIDTGDINTNNINVNPIYNTGVYQIGTQTIWNVQVADTYANNIPNVYVPSWMITQPGISTIGLPILTTTGGIK